MVEFGEGVEITYVMGGLARELSPPHDGRVREWLECSERSGMPVDPRSWWEGPIGSTYPACMAVKAAAEQGPEAAARYLRALREGLMCLRRKLDTTEALVEEARGAGLNVQRFRVDLGSHAIVEAFGEDLEATRATGFALPSIELGGEVVSGAIGYDALRSAALASGAVASGEAPPDALGALRRFGRMATVEVEAVCELPGTRADAELWRLASDWKVRPVRVLTGMLWEAA